jgi:putative oxidoreductase
MSEVAIARSRVPSIGVALSWFFRVLVALYFLLVGSRKLMGDTMWVTIFEQIGAGQWFRYLTGMLQVTGALLVLIPRTFLIGMSILAATMVGAMLAWILVLHEPRSAMLPAVLLAVLLAIGLAFRNQEAVSRVALKSPWKCKCPCHKGAVLVHPVPCCASPFQGILGKAK